MPHSHEARADTVNSANTTSSGQAARAAWPLKCGASTSTKPPHKATARHWFSKVADGGRL